MRKFTVVCLALAFSTAGVFSATVDTLNVFSEKMNKKIKVVVIKPQTYGGEKTFPVLYLLHGYGGRYDNWLTKVPHIKELSDQYEMMIVCPDGSIGSWYLDSPEDQASQYETFISKELVENVDKNYKTVPSREGRAITGLSMGGHGGLYLGFRNQYIFGACGSMSGGVDIRPFPNKWDISKRIGTQREYPERWEKNTVMGLLHLLTPDALKIIIDCGTEDFFFDVNERLHNELLYRNIPHDYITRPGGHNWGYWSNAVKYQVLFFNEYFRSRQ
ncbi:alpha/beta hydrolase [Proteiniphilum sp. UBA5384]|uniref:alpha/beta hydrolase n=1 Tax=Proteiniphilum sp. UBA5384 TaxID=1947279 RepID=UPI0025D9E13A|nr:alpha/beta hydrolase family protein [Proteiniphilum sp. UBA5384]